MDMNLSKALGVGDGQGNLACCRPWGYQGLHATEQLNNNNLKTVTLLLLLLFSFFFPVSTLKFMSVYLLEHRTSSLSRTNVC